MNFLAHLYLACLPSKAGTKEDLIAGNFIADAVKGKQFERYDKGIVQGILMHREIDFFSDNNPVYLQSVHRLQPEYGKYSGVITDMFYDHLLAQNWNAFSTADLKTFCKQMYVILSSYTNKMPEESRIIMGYMIEFDWLFSYAQTEGIRQALEGMSKRMKYYFPMDKAVEELKKNYGAYNQDFLAFFPLLVDHIASWMPNEHL